MKYLLLIYGDEQQWATTPQAEMDARIGKTQAFNEQLHRDGRLLSAQRLQPSTTATLIRMHGHGKTSITDGPFAETREQLGGYLLIDARDLNEAMRIASQFPCGEGATIEIRPVQDLLTSDQLAAADRRDEALS